MEFSKQLNICSWKVTKEYSEGQVIQAFGWARSNQWAQILSLKYPIAPIMPHFWKNSVQMTANELCTPSDTIPHAQHLHARTELQ